MGDYFQTIVDETATEDEAQSLSERVLEWLVAEKIVESEPSDCILGSDPGYRPGSGYHQFVEFNQPDVDKSDKLFRSLAVNGLEVVTERTVFDAGGSGFSLVCEHCGTIYGDNELIEEWGNAVDEWYSGSGIGLITCPKCGITLPVTAWTHDPPFGFGSLGFQFWNWPKLSSDFIKDVERLLGHSTKLVIGKM